MGGAFKIPSMTRRDDPTRRERRRRRALAATRHHWLVRRGRQVADRVQAASFSHVGLCVAACFFAASVTPSLLPRHYGVQGVVSGIAVSIGYGIGRLIRAVVIWMQIPGLAPRPRRVLQRIATVMSAAVFANFLWRMTDWQNELRALVGMPPTPSAAPLRSLLIAAVVVAALFWVAAALARLRNWIDDHLDEYLPRRVAAIASVGLTIALVVSLINGVLTRGLLAAADRFFITTDRWMDPDQPPPSDPKACGSPESLIAWQTVGRRGRDFLAGGVVDDTGGDVRPVRVYAGLRTAASPGDRAAVALAETIRLGGFDRSRLVVATPTGTGWIDDAAVDPLELMHRGDTAIVSMQYSYLPSWLTILVDPDRSLVASEALFDAVYAHWKTLPADSRPQLYLQGLSLGALGSEGSADLLDTFEDPIDGALWSGPPFPARRWADAVSHREPDTPVWQPIYRDSRLLRFAGPGGVVPSGPRHRWGPIRNVYLQYASDPMVWFRPDLWWRRPEWLDAPRGPDVSPSLRWMPIVTFLQVGFDLPRCTLVPDGHGHHYAAADYIDAWAEVTQPADWTADRSAKLKMRFDPGPTPTPAAKPARHSAATAPRSGPRTNPSPRRG